MKKNLSNSMILAALLAAGAALTACSDNDDLKEQQSQVTIYKLSITASKGSDAITRALTGGDGSPLVAEWKTGEKVYVQVGGTILDGYLEAMNDGVTTVLEGVVTTVEGSGTLNDGVELNLIYPNPDVDYTGQNGKLTGEGSISEKYDFAGGRAKITEVSGEKVFPEYINSPIRYTEIKAVNISYEYDPVEDNYYPVTGGPVEFENRQAIVRFSLVKEDGTTPFNATALTIDAKDIKNSSRILQNSASGTYGPITIERTSPADNVIYAALYAEPDWDDDEIMDALTPENVFLFNYTLTAVDGTDTYTCTAENVGFEPGKYYEINVKMTKQP
ncbi:MAG: hypothetical protein J6T18_07170 [Bacteroidaceae bacterium]|nr:hypothetical protein [Bacteroidaceae bacterium]